MKSSFYIVFFKTSMSLFILVQSKVCVMVNFNCQLEWVTDCPGIQLKIISGCVFVGGQD